jgi:hypothetical protein
VDAEQLFATNSPQGLTGAEYFYEHVHLTSEGTELQGIVIASFRIETGHLGSLPQ